MAKASERRGHIEISGLGFSYPDGTAVIDDLTLKIDGGEMVAVIGQNGSGKTTLAKCVGGILQPSRGQIRIDGTPTFVRRKRTPALVERVGYVFQNPDHQIFSQSVYEEIAYGLRRLHMPSNRLDERVREAAEVCGISADLFDEHPFFLPKGMRQRIAIASILALRPSALIVDEPTTGQDFSQSVDIMQFLQFLNGAGHTVIMITHEMDLVVRYARRVIGMAGGRILVDAPPEQAFLYGDVLTALAVQAPDVIALGKELQGYTDDMPTTSDQLLALCDRVLGRPG